MADIDKLREKFDQAEGKAHEIQADRDDALAKVRDRFDDRLRKAVDAAAAAQKEWLDAEAAATLAERFDLGDRAQREQAELEFDRLGLTLPNA